MGRKRDSLWEETIKQLLGDDNPCDICLVKVTCSKSFTDRTACEPLAVKLTEASERARNENKN